MFNARVPVESDPQLPQLYHGTYEPVRPVVIERRERKIITPKTIFAIGVAALSLTTAAFFGQRNGVDEGARSRQAEIAQLQAAKDEAENRAEGASKTADYWQEIHRADNARSAVYSYFGSAEKLPKFVGIAEVYMNDQLLTTITDPIVLSPNYGATGKDIHDEGWQAIASRSRDRNGGIDVYVKGSTEYTVNFIADGVVLTDDEVWSASTGHIVFDTMRMSADVNGDPEIVGSDGFLVGMTS